MKQNISGGDSPDPQPFEPVGDIVSIFQRGPVWYANFQHAGKQRRLSLKTTSKKEAIRQARLLEADLLRHQYQPDDKPPTIADGVHKYTDHLRTEGRAKKTLQKYETLFKQVVALGIELKRGNLLGIDLSFMDAFRKARTGAGCAPKTVYNESTIIRQLINFARTRKLIYTDPLSGLLLKKPKPTPQPCWTPEQVEQILTASREPQRRVFMVLADTGMRVGELCWLTWSDIDLKSNVIHIRPKEGWKPKTGDQRAIPLTGRVRQMCETLPRKHRWVFTAAGSTQHPGTDRQLSERRLLRSLKRVLKRIELPGHLHTFRHAFISKSLLAGIPEAVVRGWVGHVDQEILKIYTHVADQVSQSAMRKFDETQPSQGPSGKDAQE